MKVWFEIPTKAGLVKIEVPELPACVGSDRSAEVRLRHPSVAAFHALIHASAEGVGISAILPSNQLIYDGNDCRSIPLDDGDRIKIGEVPVLVRIEEDETEDEDQDAADVLTLDDTDEFRVSDDNDHDDGEDDVEEEGGGSEEEHADERSATIVYPDSPRASASLTPSESGGDTTDGNTGIRLASIPPSDFPNHFLDEAGDFQSWVTLEDADSVTSYFVLRYCSDWRRRRLVSGVDFSQIPEGGCFECGNDGLSQWPIAAVEKTGDPARFQMSIPLNDGFVSKFRVGAVLTGYVYASRICNRCAAIDTSLQKGSDQDPQIRKVYTAPAVWWSKTIDIDDLPETAIGPGIAGTWFLQLPEASSHPTTLIASVKNPWPVEPRKYSDLYEYWYEGTGDSSYYAKFLKPIDLALSLKARRQRLMRMQQLDSSRVDPASNTTLKVILDVAVSLTAAWAKMIERRNASETSR